MYIDLSELGCIVNLAGNAGLHHGEDVPVHERTALLALYEATHGPTAWSYKTNWGTAEAISKVIFISSPLYTYICTHMYTYTRINSGIRSVSSAAMYTAS